MCFSVSAKTTEEVLSDCRTLLDSSKASFEKLSTDGKRRHQHSAYKDIVSAIESSKSETASKKTEVENALSESRAEYEKQFGRVRRFLARFGFGEASKFKKQNLSPKETEVKSLAKGIRELDTLRLTVANTGVQASTDPLLFDLVLAHKVARNELYDNDRIAATRAILQSKEYLADYPRILNTVKEARKNFYSPEKDIVMPFILSKKYEADDIAILSRVVTQLRKSLVVSSRDSAILALGMVAKVKDIRKLKDAAMLEAEMKQLQSTQDLIKTKFKGESLLSDHLYPLTRVIYSRGLGAAEIDQARAIYRALYKELYDSNRSISLTAAMVANKMDVSSAAKVIEFYKTLYKGPFDSSGTTSLTAAAISTGLNNVTPSGIIEIYRNIDRQSFDTRTVIKYTTLYLSFLRYSAGAKKKISKLSFDGVPLQQWLESREHTDQTSALSVVGYLWDHSYMPFLENPAEHLMHEAFGLHSHHLDEDHDHGVDTHDVDTNDIDNHDIDTHDTVDADIGHDDVSFDSDTSSFDSSDSSSGSDSGSD
jgi:hypothetical protein